MGQVIEQQIPMLRRDSTEHAPHVSQYSGDQQLGGVEIAGEMLNHTEYGVHVGKEEL